MALCLLLAATFLLQSRHDSRPYIQVLLVVIDQLKPVAWAALILTSGLSIGCLVLRFLRLRSADNTANALFGLGLGLGALSLATLALGVIGLTQHGLLVGVLMIFLLVGLGEIGRILRESAGVPSRMRRASWFRWVLWGVLGLFLLMNLTRAFEPTWEYDSLEYHVAAPAAYHRAGRVFFMRDNVYANFPQNVEMLHFLAMRLTGPPDRGVIVGQLIAAALGFLTALALRRMIGGVAGREAGDIAAVIFYTWPGVTRYSGMPYVELPLIFYGTLALWGLLWSWRRRLTKPCARGWVALSGVAAGLALGCKYTAALLIFVPVGGLLVVLGVLGRSGWKGAVRRSALFAVVALLLFSPWLVRNSLTTGNPAYPLLYKVFGSSNWDAQKDARWTHAHAPPGWSLSNLLAQGREALLMDEGKASLLLFLFLPAVLLVGRRLQGVVLLLGAYLLALFLLWFLFTQHNVRFLEVGVPALAALSALGLCAVRGKGHIPTLRAILVVLLILGPSRRVNYLNVQRSLGVALGAVSPEEYFDVRGGAAPDFRYGYAAMKFINDEGSVPEGSKILFLGEARTFYCRRDHVASTVFDTNLLETVMRDARTPDDLFQSLRAEGITHLYADTGELFRLQESYRFPYEGREVLGMLDGFDWDLFDAFARRHLRLVPAFAGAGAGNFRWENWEAFVRRYIAEGGARHPPGGHIIALYALR